MLHYVERRGNMGRKNVINVQTVIVLFPSLGERINDSPPKDLPAHTLGPL